MKMTKLMAVAAMTIASMGIVAGTAYADPAPAPRCRMERHQQREPGHRRYRGRFAEQREQSPRST